MTNNRGRRPGATNLSNRPNQDGITPAELDHALCTLAKIAFADAADPRVAAFLQYLAKYRRTTFND